MLQGRWRLIFAGSRFTTDVESRYTPVEGEALAVVHTLEKCSIFVQGCPNLTTVVDHKPLVKILGDRNLEDIKNPHLLSLKDKTLIYRFHIQHIPGTQHAGPDACSRYPPVQTKIASCTSLMRVPASEHDIDTSYDTDLHVESCVYSAMVEGTLMAMCACHHPQSGEGSIRQ